MSFLAEHTGQIRIQLHERQRLTVGIIPQTRLDLPKLRAEPRLKQREVLGLRLISEGPAHQTPNEIELTSVPLVFGELRLVLWAGQDGIMGPYRREVACTERVPACSLNGCLDLSALLTPRSVVHAAAYRSGIFLFSLPFSCNMIFNSMICVWYGGIRTFSDILDHSTSEQGG